VDAQVHCARRWEPPEKRKVRALLALLVLEYLLY
jgi:hypothetical protein